MAWIAVSPPGGSERASASVETARVGVAPWRMLSVRQSNLNHSGVHSEAAQKHLESLAPSPRHWIAEAGDCRDGNLGRKTQTAPQVAVLEGRRCC